jgi:hypothetical protein
MPLLAEGCFSDRFSSDRILDVAISCGRPVPSRTGLRECKAMIVREMTTRENTDVAAAGRMARLACARDGQPYLVSIHYAFADRCLYGFSMPGQKIGWMRQTRKYVCPPVLPDQDRKHDRAAGD